MPWREKFNVTHSSPRRDKYECHEGPPWEPWETERKEGTKAKKAQTRASTGVSMGRARQREVNSVGFANLMIPTGCGSEGLSLVV